MNPKTPPSTQADLRTVLSDVLGDLAFMVTESSPTGPSSPGTVWMRGEIAYYGPRRGTLRCWCTRRFATRLGANLLGIEPEEGEAQLASEDAVREFLNVLCGQLVTAWHGTESVFDLTIPTVCESTDSPRVDDASSNACYFIVDGEPLYCTYVPESPSEEAGQ